LILPAHEDGTECSETSAYKIQTPGNYPEENIQQMFNNVQNRNLNKATVKRSSPDSEKLLKPRSFPPLCHCCWVSAAEDHVSGIVSEFSPYKTKASVTVTLAQPTVSSLRHCRHLVDTTTVYCILTTGEFSQFLLYIDSTAVYCMLTTGEFSQFLLYIDSRAVYYVLTTGEFSQFLLYIDSTVVYCMLTTGEFSQFLLYIDSTVVYCMLTTGEFSQFLLYIDSTVFYCMLTTGEFSQFQYSCLLYVDYWRIFPVPTVY
jgi:hypothetical protein